MLTNADCPLYPFGFGFHYAAVEYQNLKDDEGVDRFSATCKVTKPLLKPLVMKLPRSMCESIRLSRAAG